MGIIDIVMYIFTSIGGVSSIWFLVLQFQKFQRYTWKNAEKIVNQMIHNMNEDGFSPSLICGIGRGGAILGAMISGILDHRPLVVLDRVYEWTDDQRTDYIYEELPLEKDLDKILLITSEVYSGNTIRLFYQYLQKIGGKEIKKAAFYYRKGSTEKVDYIGIEGTKSNFRFPWMFNNKYNRDSR